MYIMKKVTILKNTVTNLYCKWFLCMSVSHYTTGFLKASITLTICIYVIRCIVVVQLLVRVQLCDPMDCSMPGFPVIHYLPEFAQTYVHWVHDAIKPSHSMSPPSPSALNLPQYQGLFQWVSSLHQVAKVLELQLQHQSFKHSGCSFLLVWLTTVESLCMLIETMEDVLRSKDLKCQWIWMIWKHLSS